MARGAMRRLFAALRDGVRRLFSPSTHVRTADGGPAPDRGHPDRRRAGRAPLARSAAPPGAEAGDHRTAGRRHRARLQQHPRGHSRQQRAARVGAPARARRSPGQPAQGPGRGARRREHGEGPARLQPPGGPQLQHAGPARGRGRPVADGPADPARERGAAGRRAGGALPRLGRQRRPAADPAQPRDQRARRDGEGRLAHHRGGARADARHATPRPCPGSTRSRTTASL